MRIFQNYNNVVFNSKVTIILISSFHNRFPQIWGLVILWTQSTDIADLNLKAILLIEVGGEISVFRDVTSLIGSSISNVVAGRSVRNFAPAFLTGHVPGPISRLAY